MPLQQELSKKHPFDLPEEEAYLNLLRTAGVLSAGFASLFKEHGLSEATYNVLRILRGVGAGGCPCGQISERMVTHVPDVTRLADRLVEQGLARRTRTRDDRRVVLVEITRKGLDLLARLDKPVGALHIERLGHLKRSEIAELNRLLVKARTPDERR